MEHSPGSPALQDRNRRIAETAYNKYHASQKIPELARALDRVAAIHPQIIVEIGCDAGGTLYGWTQLADQVYGVTFPENTLASGGQGTGYQLETHDATVIYGDSHDPQVRAQLESVLPGPVDVLHIDGDHSYEGVKADFEDYSPLVRPGGLVLLHDAANRHNPKVEVPRFFEELGGELIAGPGRPLGFGIWTKEK